MKKLLLILGIVSASCAFSQECPAAYNGFGFNQVFFITDASADVTSPAGYIGNIVCNYGSENSGYANLNLPGTFMVEQPENFWEGPSGFFVCQSGNPVNCKFLPS